MPGYQMSSMRWAVQTRSVSEVKCQSFSCNGHRVIAECNLQAPTSGWSTERMKQIGLIHNTVCIAIILMMMSCDQVAKLSAATILYRSKLVLSPGVAARLS